MMIRQPTSTGVPALGLAALIPLALVLACSSQEVESAHEAVDLRDDPKSTEPGARELRAAEWITMFSVGGTESDTTFYSTSALEADSAGVFVLDHGRRKIARLTANGKTEWWYGGPGRGPDEFMHVRDIESGPDGNLWILDVDNARVTVLEPSGQAVIRIPIRDLPHPDALVPLTGSELVLVTLSREHPLVVIEPGTGTVLEKLGLPWPGYQKIHPLAAQMIAAGRDGRFVVAFSIGNGFFTFRGTKALPYYGTFVEHTPFPRVVTVRQGNTRTTRFDRKPVFSAYEIDVDSGRLYVLFAGSTEHRYRVIDIYDLSTGRYLHSLKLPRPVSSIAVSGDRIYGTYSDPYPAVVAWRWSDRKPDESGPAEAKRPGAGQPTDRCSRGQP